MKKYIEIINNNIESSEIHPYNDIKSKTNYQIQMINILFNDLKAEFPNIIKETSDQNILSVRLQKNSEIIYFYVDHVDSGGRTLKSDKKINFKNFKKKVSIDFSKESFTKILRNKEKVFIVNFYYFLSRNANDVLSVDNKFCYIVLNPDEILSSKNYDNMHIKKQAPSSRWISLNSILEFVNSETNYFTIKNKIGNPVFFLIKSGFFNDLFLSLGIFDIPSKSFSNLIFDISNSSEQLAEITNDIHEISSSSRSKTEIKRLIDCRLGQGEYREKLIKLYNGKCVLTNIDYKGILVASHILPWKKSNDFERLDKYNGLLLSSNVDKLFDKFEISFDLNGILVLSCNINYQLLEKLGVNKIWFNTPISEKISKETQKYLSEHYRIFQIKQKKIL